MVNKTVLGILFVCLTACAHQSKDVGEWVPMTDSEVADDNSFLDKHKI